MNQTNKERQKLQPWKQGKIASTQETKKQIQNKVKERQIYFPQQWDIHLNYNDDNN